MRDNAEAWNSGEAATRHGYVGVLWALLRGRRPLHRTGVVTRRIGERSRHTDTQLSIGVIGIWVAVFASGVLAKNGFQGDES